MAVEIMIARQLTYFAAREKDAGPALRPRGRHGQAPRRPHRLVLLPTTRCRSTAATASRSNTRSAASSATPASSRSSRAPPKSRPRSSPAACSRAAADSSVRTLPSRRKESMIRLIASAPARSVQRCRHSLRGFVRRQIRARLPARLPAARLRRDGRRDSAPTLGTRARDSAADGFGGTPFGLRARALQPTNRRRGSASLSPVSGASLRRRCPFLVRSIERDLVPQDRRPRPSPVPAAKIPH